MAQQHVLPQPVVPEVRTRDQLQVHQEGLLTQGHLLLQGAVPIRGLQPGAQVLTPGLQGLPREGHTGLRELQQIDHIHHRVLVHPGLTRRQGLLPVALTPLPVHLRDEAIPQHVLRLVGVIRHREAQVLQVEGVIRQVLQAQVEVVVALHEVLALLQGEGNNNT